MKVPRFNDSSKRKELSRFNPNVSEFKISKRIDNKKSEQNNGETFIPEFAELKTYQITPRGTSLLSDYETDQKLEELGIKKNKTELEQYKEEVLIKRNQQKSEINNIEITKDKKNDKKEDNKEEMDDKEIIKYKTRNNLPKDLKAYDGTPIHIVAGDEHDKIIKGFLAGTYGVDTESDCRTADLRVIQIYDGKIVYIFFADSLLPSINCPLTKFMASKDRIKIGVDIDGDISKMTRHLSREKGRQIKYHREDVKRVSNLRKYNPTMNGFIDVQSIARSIGDRGFSLDKLAHKYVEDFKGNNTVLGSYIDPTPEQYIYAANDAILSLKIYRPLIDRISTKRWIEEQKLIDRVPFNKEDEKTLLFGWIVPLVSGIEPKRISVLVSQIVNSYKSWQNYDRSFREAKAYQLIVELAEERMFDDYDRVGQTIRLRQIELKETNTTKEALFELAKEKKEKEIEQKLLEEKLLEEKLLNEKSKSKAFQEDLEDGEEEFSDEINRQFSKITEDLQSADTYMTEHPEDFSILPEIKELIKVSEEKILALKDRQYEQLREESDECFVKLLQNFNNDKTSKKITKESLDEIIISIEIVRDYNNILNCLLRCVQKSEPPKAKPKFVKQLANSYGYWIKSYPSIQERMVLAELFFDMAYEKKDIVFIAHGLFSLKRG
jgi:hypothetical protein